MRHFLRNAGTLTIGNGLSAAIGALSIIVVIRNLEVSEWAMAAIIVSLGPMVSLLVSLGTVTYGVRELSLLNAAHSRLTRFAKFLGQRLAVCMLLALSGLILGALQMDIAAAVFILASFRFFRGASVMILSSELRFVAQSAVIVAEKLLVLGAVSILLQLGLTVYALPAAQAVAAFLASVTCLRLSRLRGYGRCVARGLRRPHRMWRGSGYFGVTSLASSLQQSDVALVALVASSEEAGIFAAAARLPSTLNVLGGALAQVVIPTVSGARLDLWAILKRSRKVLGAVCVGVVATISVLIGTAGLWVPWLLGAEYGDAISVVQVYLTAICFVVLNQPVVALLQALDDERFAARVVSINVLLALCLQTAGAVWAGALGASWGFMIATLSISVAMMGRVSMHVRKSKGV